MHSLFEQHLVACREAGEQAETLATRSRWQASFSAFCAAHQLALEDLTRADLEKYQQHLLWSPAGHGKLPAAATVYQAMSMLRKFLRWCVRHGHLEADPTAGWVFGRPAYGEKRLLSRSELDTILNAPNDSPLGLRDRALLGIYAELGLFGIDCHKLKLSDVDLAAYRLRHLPLSPSLTEHLSRYLRQGRPALLTDPDETALFLTRLGTPISGNTSDTVLLRHTPGNRVSPRVLRRSWMAHRDAMLSRRLPGSQHCPAKTTSCQR